MSICINPQCPQPESLDELLFCRGCGSGLLLGNKYRVTKLMSEKGGLGGTYEIVEEWVPKVLKILKSDRPDAGELFDREFRFLNEVTGKDIPSVSHVEDLFTYKPNGYHEAFYCLVNERINGMDLTGYLKIINCSIDERTAISWLSQLTQILDKIHSRQIFHRDIKPSNIILQPNGRLALVDFGRFKEISNNDPGSNSCLSPGYSPTAKQKLRRTLAQTDLFALGRTFVYLLTQKEPIDLYDSEQNTLTWRNLTTDISPNFLDSIDRLMQENFAQQQDRSPTMIRNIYLPQPETIDLPIASSPPPTPTLTPIPISTPIPIPIPIPIQTSAPPPIPTPILGKSNPAQRSKKIHDRYDRDIVIRQSSPNTILPLLVKISLPLGFLLAAGIGWLVWNNKSPQTSRSTNATAGAFSQVKGVPNGAFKFGGSTTWATTRQPNIAIDSLIKGAFPGYNIDYIDNSSPNVNIKSISTGKCDKKPGSNTGICWLIEGDLDFAQSSVSLSKSKYADLVAANHLTEEAVAYDALTIVVNRELNIPGLTVEQLRGIYTGKITNWSQVNGPNLPIVPFSVGESSGSFSSFKDLVLQKGEELKATFVATNSEGLQKIKSGKGGIYYGSAKEVIVDSCLTQPIPIGLTVNTFKPYQEPLQPLSACMKGERNKINPEVIKNQTYPLTRKIYVIIKADGTDRQKAGEAYAKLLKTEQGQELLERAGFVRIAN
jgi:phosphate transport system substrate-binding protein